MDNELKLLVGTWLDAIGTDLVAYGEIREMLQLNDHNKLIITLGEALESYGSLLMAPSMEAGSLRYKGNMMNGMGEMMAMMGNYHQHLATTSSKMAISYEVIGDGLQMIGSSMMSMDNHKNKEPFELVANALQAIGAGLESYGAHMNFTNQEEQSAKVAALGSVIQSLGSSLSALITTRNYVKKLSVDRYIT